MILAEKIAVTHQSLLEHRGRISNSNGNFAVNDGAEPGLGHAFAQQFAFDNASTDNPAIVSSYIRRLCSQHNGGVRPRLISDFYDGVAFTGVKICSATPPATVSRTCV